MACAYVGGELCLESSSSEQAVELMVENLLNVCPRCRVVVKRNSMNM